MKILRYHSPIVASGAIRRAHLGLLHIKNHVPLVLETLIVVLAGPGTGRYPARYCDGRQGLLLLLLLLLDVHPVPRLPSLQHTRLLCHLDHQRLNPRCPPITTHIEHNMHYPYWPDIRPLSLSFSLFLSLAKQRAHHRRHRQHHLRDTMQKQGSLARDAREAKAFCEKLRRSWAGRRLQRPFNAKMSRYESRTSRNPRDIDMSSVLHKVHIFLPSIFSTLPRKHKTLFGEDALMVQIKTFYADRVYILFGKRILFQIYISRKHFKIVFLTLKKF